MSYSNNDKTSSAENGEGRPLIKENAGQPSTHPTQSGERVSQGLAGVRKAARENKKMGFTALLHHLTVDLLREGLYSLKKKAAPGARPDLCGGYRVSGIPTAIPVGPVMFGDSTTSENICIATFEELTRLGPGCTVFRPSSSSRHSKSGQP